MLVVLHVPSPTGVFCSSALICFAFLVPNVASSHSICEILIIAAATPSMYAHHGMPFSQKGPHNGLLQGNSCSLPRPGFVELEPKGLYLTKIFSRGAARHRVSMVDATSGQATQAQRAKAKGAKPPAATHKCAELTRCTVS